MVHKSLKQSVPIIVKYRISNKEDLLYDKLVLSSELERWIMHFFHLLLLLAATMVLGGSKNKPHVHQGVIEAYDGKPLPLHLSNDQLLKLDKGEAVLYNERTGKSGRGVVIQDINASTVICMERIRDLEKYTKVVPHVKKVEIYENQHFPNGTTKTGAEFGIGLMGLNFQYFLQLTHEPKYNTLTWTLDYKHNSDFDDNVGHWQVMPHPSKSGWTRLLYSTKIKLFSWIPEFIVNFLTSKALTESTSWVKRESELEASRQALSGISTVNSPTKKKNSWFNINGGSFSGYTRATWTNAEDDLGKIKPMRFMPRFTLRPFKH